MITITRPSILMLACTWAALGSIAKGQTPTPGSVAPAPIVMVDLPSSTDTPSAVTIVEEAPPAVNPYAGDLFTRQRLTGDWWGARSKLDERGLTFNLFATQFYQGIAAGGRERGFEYGGKLDYLLGVDGQKLGLWKGIFVDMHAETRYGTDVNEMDGLIAPSNLAMAFPEAGQNITSITGLKFTQMLSENFALYAGKINTLDEYPLRYQPNPGNNKPGQVGFMNTSLVFNPIAGRTIPYSAAGVGGAFLSEGEPLFSLTVFDPEERATTGLENLYERGVVIMPDFVLRGKLFGKPGLLNLGGTYSNAKYSSLDPAAYLNIVSQIRSRNPDLAERAPVETGSWSLYANFYQSLWVDACDEKRNWGVFGQLGLSDGNPNPIGYVVNIGIGGRSMLPGRHLDNFGAGFFYLGLSNNFKAVTRPFAPQRDEYGVELFYNFAVTPWCHVTPDVQFVRPSSVGLDTAIIPGIRLQLLF